MSTIQPITTTPPPLKQPQRDSPQNPNAAKTGSVAHNALKDMKARIPSQGTARIVTICRAICFPITWLIEKIITLFKVFIDICRDIAADDILPAPPELPPPPAAPLEPTESYRNLFHSFQMLNEQLEEISEHSVKKLSARFADAAKMMQNYKFVVEGEEDVQSILRLDASYESVENVREMMRVSKKELKSLTSSLQTALETLAAANERCRDEKLLKLKGQVQAKLQEQEKHLDLIRKEFSAEIKNWKNAVQKNKAPLAKAFAGYQKEFGAAVDIVKKYDWCLKANSAEGNGQPVYEANEPALLRQVLKKLICEGAFTFFDKEKLNTSSSGRKIQSRIVAGLALYDEYRAVHSLMKYFHVIDQTHEDTHQALLKENIHFSDGQGLKNIGNTCWMNATLQSLRGCKEVSNRINALKQPAQYYTESEGNHKSRIEMLLPPVKRVNDEAYEAFEKRIQDFIDKYPVQRSEEAAKIIYDWRMRNYNRLLIKEGVIPPAIINAETDEEFAARIKTHQLTHYKAIWTNQGEKNLAKRLTDKEQFYRKQISDRLLKESDDEFQIRTNAFNAEVARKQHTPEDMRLRQQVLDALKEVWKAWDIGEDALTNKLRGLQHAIHNGIHRAEFNEYNLNFQNDSGAFVEILMDILGFVNQEKSTKKSVQLVLERSTIQPVLKWTIPLVGIVNGEDVNNLIAGSAQEHQRNDPSNQWNVDQTADGRRVTSFSERFSIDSEPQQVMVLKFERRRRPGVNELEDKKEQDSKSDDEANNQQAIDFKDYIVDMTPLFSEEACKQNNKSSIRYRIVGFVEHGGNAQGGHYVGVRNLEKANGRECWVSYSDETIDFLSVEQLKNRSMRAYMAICELIP